MTLLMAQLAVQGLSFAAARLLSASSDDPQRSVGAAVCDVVLVALTVAASPFVLMTAARYGTSWRHQHPTTYRGHCDGR